MSEAIERLREHFNDMPVPKGAKCLAEERENVNALIDAVEAENTQLRDRNEKLRDEFRKMDEWHSKELVAATDENAKLRELVRFANKTVEGLCGMVENSPGCSMCPLNQDEDRACGAAELFSRMDELGIEVE